VPLVDVDRDPFPSLEQAEKSRPVSRAARQEIQPVDERNIAAARLLVLLVGGRMLRSCAKNRERGKSW
jgi:hypothetical protein